MPYSPNTQIVLNRIQTPDGTKLTSYHRHDYVEYKDTIDNTIYMVDGGIDYLKRSGKNYKDLTVYINDDYELVRESLHRYNSKTNEYVSTKDMSDEWLENLIIYLMERQTESEFPLNIYLQEEAYRKAVKRDKVIDSI